MRSLFPAVTIVIATNTCTKTIFLSWVKTLTGYGWFWVVSFFWVS